MPSKIYIISLLLNSEAYQKALLKVLKQPRVTQNIMVDQFDGVVFNINACSNLSFSNDKLSAERIDHN